LIAPRIGVNIYYRYIRYILEGRAGGEGRERKGEKRKKLQ